MLVCDIELIRQECDRSCGVACVAMVAGKTFGEVRAMVDDPGLNSQDIDRLLGRCGVAFERQLHPTLAAHQVYIVTVPSLNVRGGLHYIVLFTEAENADGTVECSLLDPVREGKQSYMDGGFLSWAECVRIVGVARG